MKVNVDRLDHLVLTVRSIRESCDFYTTVPGMREVTFGAGRKALAFGAQKINLHEQGNQIEPKAHRTEPGSPHPTRFMPKYQSPHAAPERTRSRGAAPAAAALEVSGDDCVVTPVSQRRDVAGKKRPKNYRAGCGHLTA